MTLKTPPFWYDTTKPTPPLADLAARVYGLAHQWHQSRGKAQQVPIPVICVGNLVAGGGGKTPVALALMDMICNGGLAKNPCFLTRGYGGSLAGPVLVTESIARADMVGDEPILLSHHAPVIVSHDRVAGARHALGLNHDMVIMDDGLQNPSLHKDLKLIVIDGASGFGNEKLLPAGPLRTPLHRGLGMADAFIIIGHDLHGIESRLPAGRPVYRATATYSGTWTPDAGYLAFCGIAQPGKFRAGLAQAGINVVEFRDFADHYAYTPFDLETLAETAKTRSLRLITTEKDAARLPPDFIQGQDFDILSMSLVWDPASETALSAQIQTIRPS